MREGNTIILIQVYFDEKKYLWAYYYNHDTKAEIYFNNYRILRNVTKKAYVSPIKYFSWHSFESIVIVPKNSPDFDADNAKLKNLIAAMTKDNR